MAKRILSALVLSAVLLATLVACGNQPDETTPVATTPSSINLSDAVLCKDGQGNYYAMSTDGKTFLFYYPENKATSFVVPEGVERVADGAFAYIPHLKDLSFASSVREIGWIFSSDFDAITLEKLTVPASVQSYRDREFEIHSPTLKELVLLCDIDGFQLADCDELTHLTVTSIPKDISGAVLENCGSLRTISVVGQASMRDEAFEAYCATKNSAPVLYIPEGVETLGVEAIYASVNVYLPDTIKSVDENFYYRYSADPSLIVSAPADARIGESGSVEGVGEVILRPVTANSPAQTEPPISMKLSGEYRSPEEAPLTDAEKKEILSFFTEAGKPNYSFQWWEKGDSIVSSSCEWRYYGRIGEAVVVAEPAEFWEEELALYVYQDGVSCAFSVAECPEEARLAVEEYHQSIMTKIQNGPPEGSNLWNGQPIPPLEAPPSNELILAYISELHYPCYIGTYNGYAAYYYDTNEDSVRSVIIEGIHFIIGMEDIVFLAEGEEYLLEKAYALGLLTYEDLRIIAWYCYGTI